MRTVDDKGAVIDAPPHLRYVDDVNDVADALAVFDGALIGVDVERADSTAYFRRAALIQIGDAHHCVLLDGVALSQLDAVNDLINNGVTAVFHAAENDLDPLARKHVRPDRIADTAIAAAMLGLPTGLGPLLEQLLGISLSADKESFQRADWEARPLNEAMLNYAAADVVHLPALWRALEVQLQKAGRTAWYEEELRATISQAFAYDRHWSRVKGAGRLDHVQQARLQALWHTREQLAQTHDLAPNYLLRDEVLLDFANDPPRTVAQLLRRAPRNRSVCRPHADELLGAVDIAAENLSDQRPRTLRRQTSTDRAVVAVLRQTRANVAAEVGIDPGVLCPAKRLLTAVLRDPTGPQQLAEALDLRTWQASLLAEPLWQAYAAAHNGQVDD